MARPQRNPRLHPGWVTLVAVWLLGAALVAASYLVSTGTIGASSTESVSSAPEATVLAASVDRIDSSDVRDQLESSVVLTDVNACGVDRQGTTTLLRTSRGVLGFTNAHVARGSESVRLAGAGLGVDVATVQRFLDGRDVAVLDVTAMALSPENGLNVAEVPPVGTELYTAGFPNGAWTVRTGRLVSVEQRSIWGTTATMLVIDSLAEEGLSGGVVVDGQGRAVGLVAERDPRTGYTVAYPANDLFNRADAAVPGC